MAVVRLGLLDRKDLEKYTESFALNAALIIVESRLGVKVYSKCKTHASSTDSFHLAIQDLPEVQAETKKLLYGNLVNAHLPMCVEISLRTVEGDTMLLETWCIGISPDQCDPSVRVTYTVYHRICVLLKSLLTTTRVIPGYKLSRCQGPDTFVMCYRIYMGEPQLHNLGEEYNQVRVGQVSTHVGTIQLTVSYRTKMIISPKDKGKNAPIMLKSDHFHPDLSPRHLCCQQNEENNMFHNEIIKVGAFADIRKLPQPSESYLLMPTPFSSLLTLHRQSSRQQSSPQQALTQTGSMITNSDVGGTEELEDGGNSNIPPHCASAADSPDSSYSMVPANEDFSMEDLKRTFSGNYANSDWGDFYRECQSALQLKTFSEQLSLAEQVESIAKTLEVFESNMKEQDKMLNYLCLNENNN